MNAPLAATLIWLCCQASAMACQEAGHAPQAPHPRILIAAAAPNEPSTAGTMSDTTQVAMARTGSPLDLLHNRGPNASASSPESPGTQGVRKSAPAAAESSDTDGRLFLVGLALMAGIAVRRWGTVRR